MSVLDEGMTGRLIRGRLEKGPYSESVDKIEKKDNHERTNLYSLSLTSESIACESVTPATTNPQVRFDLVVHVRPRAFLGACVPSSSN